ncbi:MAG: hypothetical protein BGO41_14395 [Clostridiales bacterium 38-18]|nr:MAG: hypothetical protein BGO41_14395 [Clostridiales bacterium 38-18]
MAISRFEYMGDEVLNTKLECGLDIYVFRKQDFAKKYAFFATQYGGMHNDYVLDGVTYGIPHGAAHFLEHQIFEDQDKSTFERFEKLGASVNAYTSSESTVYYFETIDNFEICLKNLLEMVQKTDISDKSVAKEKSIIEQEIRMYMDEPSWELYNTFFNAFYHNHPVKDEIAGSVESIMNITPEIILSCYKHFYSPKNMKLFLYGNIDLEAILPIIENALTDEYKSRTFKPEIIIPDEPYEVVANEIEVKKDVTRPSVTVGFKGNPSYFDQDSEVKLAALRLIMDQYFGRSSRFFKHMYDLGIVTEYFDFDIQIGKGFAYFAISNESDDVIRLKEEIFNELRRLKLEDFDEEGFIRLKRKMHGRSIVSFNSLQSIANNFTHSVMRQIDIFAQLEAYQLVTVDCAIALIKDFIDLDNYTIGYLNKL